MKTLHCMMALCIGALALAGCHTVVDPVTDGPFPNTFNAVEITPGCLTDQVHVTSHAYARTANNAFEVTCTLKNLTNRPLAVQARTQYFDAERAHQEGPDAWQIVHLPAQGIETYKATSFGTDLSYYHVEIMPL
jgi:hypothetical protein